MTAVPHRLWVPVVVVLMAGLVAGVVLVATVERPSRAPRLPPVAVLAPGAVTARDFAKAACVRVRLVEQGVAANAPAATVLREVAEARELAAAAAGADATWIALSGAIASLDVALHADDGPTAGQGIRVADAACQPPGGL